MKRKKVKMIVIVGVLILALLVVVLLYFNQQTPFLSVNYYDQFGRKINQNNAFSVLTIPASYFISLTVHVNNQGTNTLNCNISYAYPDELNQALPKNTKIIKADSSAEWTSDLINLSLFIGRLQPTKFNVSVSCNSQDLSGIHPLTNQTGYIDLNISIVCGDGACQTGENIDNCPRDCVPPDRVIFRTSDLVYGSQGSVAFGAVCSSALLTKYGMQSQSCWTSTAATCPTSLNDLGTNYVKIFESIPGNPSWAYPNATAPGCIYQVTGNPNRIAIAWKARTSHGSCTISERWAIYIYDTSSPYNSVSNSPFMIDPSREISCT